MKKFDLSKLTIVKIKDVYSHTLPAHTDGTSEMQNSVLIIKRSGRTEYTVEDMKYIADIIKSKK